MENTNQENRNLEERLESQFYSRVHDPEFTVAYVNESGVSGIHIIETSPPDYRTERGYG